MKSYSELFQVRGVGRIVASQLVARFPFGMLTIAFLIHVERTHDSYAIAGIVLAFLSVGQAIAGPITSRMMSVVGMRPLLSWTIAICAVTLTSIALFPENIPLLLVLAAVAGVSTPPIQPAVRTIYPKLVSSKLLTPLFSLDATAQEIIWIVGPVMTTFIAVQFGTIPAIMAAVAFLVFGGIWFITSPAVGQVKIPRSKRRLGGVLVKPSVIISTFVGMALVASFGAVEVGVVAVFGDKGPEAGWVLGVFALGSLVGGLFWGPKAIAPWSMARRMAVVMLGLALAFFSTEFWWLIGTLFIAGLGVAPALTVLFANVSATMKFSETAESYAWIGSGQLVGVGLGSAVAGVSIDQFGAPSAILAGALFAAIATIMSIFAKPWNPDLRYQSVAPLADTDAVKVVS